MATIVSLLIGPIGSTICNSLWKIAKIKTREMSVLAKFAKISSRENFYLYSILQAESKLNSILIGIQGWIQEFSIGGVQTLFKKNSSVPECPHTVRRTVRDCHIFAHWGRSLCSKKCAQLVFSRFWLQNWRLLKFEKSCQFFDTLSFSL